MLAYIASIPPWGYRGSQGLPNPSSSVSSSHFYLCSSSSSHFSSSYSSLQFHSSGRSGVGGPGGPTVGARRRRCRRRPSALAGVVALGGVARRAPAGSSRRRGTRYLSFLVLPHPSSSFLGPFTSKAILQGGGFRFATRASGVQTYGDYSFSIVGAALLEGLHAHDVFVRLDPEERMLHDFFFQPAASFSLYVNKAVSLDRSLPVSLDRRGKPINQRSLLHLPGEEVYQETLGNGKSPP